MMKKLSPEDEVLFISSVAVKISKEFKDEELLLVGDAFSLLGQALVTIYDRRSAQSDNQGEPDKPEPEKKN